MLRVVREGAAKRAATLMPGLTHIVVGLGSSGGVLVPVGRRVQAGRPGAGLGCLLPGRIEALGAAQLPVLLLASANAHLPSLPHSDKWALPAPAGGVGPDSCGGGGAHRLRCSQPAGGVCDAGLAAAVRRAEGEAPRRRPLLDPRQLAAGRQAQGRAGCGGIRAHGGWLVVSSSSTSARCRAPCARCAAGLWGGKLPVGWRDYESSCRAARARPVISGVAGRVFVVLLCRWVCRGQAPVYQAALSI